MAKHIPNILSLLRLAFLPIWAFFYITSQPLVAIVIFSFLILTDLLDGYLARKFNWESDFGDKIDPAADKIFASFCLIVIFIQKDALLFYLFLTLVRDLAQLSAFPILILILKINFTVKPVIWSKIITVLRFLTLFLFMGFELAETLFPLELNGSTAYDFIFYPVLYLSVLGELCILVNYFWQLRNIILRKTNVFY